MAEVSFLAQAYHWPIADLLDLEHADRRNFIELVAQGDDGLQAMAEPGSWR